ncbi:MAG: DUF2760 domain-containing protein [Thiohalocapsa sp.]
MTDPQPSLSERLAPVRKVLAAIGHALGVAARETWIVLKRAPIATYSFVRALADPSYAHALTELYIAGASTLPSPAAKQPKVETPPAPAAKLQDAPPDSALVLLGLLQKEGRFVDFLQEDITSYSDQEIGTAARVVHQGCQHVMSEYLSIAPVRDESEGSRVTLGTGFDPAAVRPTGNVVGDPPFTGALVHRGWRAVDVRLPKVASSRDVRILAAAEVEL